MTVPDHEYERSLRPAAAAPTVAHSSTVTASLAGESLEMAGGTALAPSCPPSLATSIRDAETLPTEGLAPGARIDDFEIMDLLGRGGFGAVYLARQLSLDRQVALKVTAWQGGEGRKMAQLEHENIVQVFSETAFDSRTRLLCMQYVAGPTLQAVLDDIAGTKIAALNGQKLLDSVDRLVQRPAAFEPTAMRNRELLAGLDWGQTVCWIGARLAEALDYAHSRGVFHRDIKPGNIMLNQYGRPLLVDFNLSFQQTGAGPCDDRLGGTLAYMAPEHLAACAPEADSPRETIGQAADIYSLGVVLYQMASGDLPFTQTPPGATKREVLRAMAALRKELPPPLPSELPRALDQVTARCLQPEATERYSSARELSAALEGCRHYQAAERTMPDFGRMRAIVARRPVVWLFLLALAPHLLATFINIAYNDIRIISGLDPTQRAVFVRIVCWYDVIGYSIGIILGLRIVLPVARTWRAAAERLPGNRQEIDAARRTAATWPVWAGRIACLCWMPGGIVFPWALSIASRSLPLEQWAHLLVSFVLSGLIAATYSMYFVEWITLCVVYPRLWCDRQGFGATAAAELRDVPFYLRMLQVMAGLIPLIAAVLILFLGPQKSSGDLPFRFLVAGLIIFGMAGSYLAMFSTGLLLQAWEALTGSKEVATRRRSASR